MYETSKVTFCSGRLRPASQSATRTVPEHIPRPDYAAHPEGYPLSEMKLKGNTFIRYSYWLDLLKFIVSF